MMKDNLKNTVKLAGLAATGLGLVSSLLNSWVSNKNMEIAVDEKVGKAIDAYLKNNSQS